MASLCNLYTTNIRFSLHNSAEFCRSEQHYHPPILTSKAPKSSTQLHHHSTPKIPRGLNAPITPRLMIYTNQSVLNTHNLSTLTNKPKSTLKNSFIKMCPFMTNNVQIMQHTFTIPATANQGHTHRKMHSHTNNDSQQQHEHQINTCNMNIHQQLSKCKMIN